MIFYEILWNIEVYEIPYSHLSPQTQCSLDTAGFKKIMSPTFLVLARASYTWLLQTDDDVSVV